MCTIAAPNHETYVKTEIPQQKSVTNIDFSGPPGLENLFPEFGGFQPRLSPFQGPGPRARGSGPGPAPMGPKNGPVPPGQSAAPVPRAQAPNPSPEPGPRAPGLGDDDGDHLGQIVRYSAQCLMPLSACAHEGYCWHLLRVPEPPG